MYVIELFKKGKNIKERNEEIDEMLINYQLPWRMVGRQKSSRFPGKGYQKFLHSK